jgi:hypothetical protein|tara:strand:- start:3162 stop:4313 length:1152 start_codon:yes stop_codon:yes gene_type:complete
MNKKRIYLVYLILGLGLSTTYIYLDLSFREQHDDWMNTPFSTISPQYFQEPIKKFTITKTVELSDDKLIDVFSDISGYSLMLPKNVLNTKLLNVTNGIAFSEIEVVEKGIRVKFQFSQEIEENRHYVTILTGDAKGTIVEQRFIAIDDSTTEIVNAVELRLRGILSPFILLPDYNLKHAANTILDSFVDYKKLESKSEKIVDNLYRKILFRAPDSTGLEYFSSQLEAGKITPEEIESLLLESDERRQMILPIEFKSLDELDPENKKIVSNLYKNILMRDVGSDNLLLLANKLEAGKITPEEIETSLLGSLEYKYLIPASELKTIDQLKPETSEIIGELYVELLGRPADPTGVQHYGNLLESNRITIEEIRSLLTRSLEFELNK